MKIFTTLKNSVLILCLLLVSVAAFISCSDDNRQKGDNDLMIAIAWRADADNEFCTNVINTFAEAGVQVVVLDQVKAPYVQYEGNNVSSACIDSEGIGYLSEEYGIMVRTRTYQGSDIAEIMRDVDAVIFTGGEDISPTLLAIPQDWHHIEAEIDYNAARDVSDFLTMSYCIDKDIPMIGLCRGAQMLGVVSGATIIQDIPTWFAGQGLSYNYEHRREKGQGETYRDYVPHSVTLEAGSLFSEFYGTTTLTGCPSWHHQALLSTEGTPLRVTATTTVSGVEMIEGIERTDKRCAIAVQFHPEAAVVKHIGKAVNNDNADQFMSYDAGMKIFRSFLNAIMRLSERSVSADN